MSAVDSNLSDPKYGYDLVVSVTQASVNATMKQFLAGLTSPEVVECYVYDSNNALVPIDYDQLKANAKGSDPFAVANGADPNTDQDLINLADANFAGAFKAAIGLPDLPLASIPPIVTLSSGTDAPVLFNLLCSEFQICGFYYGARGKATWINQSQPTGSGDPWYFSANVKLNPGTADPNDPSLTQAVKDRAAELPAGEFSIQQLLLELDTAMLAASPTIEGIPAGWPVWSMIDEVFTGAYMTQLKTDPGKPVLGYTFAMDQPDTSTLQLGAVTNECDALLDQSGHAIPNPTVAQQNAATLEYLGTTSTTPPTAVEFGWNWVELGDVGSYSGVQAVRRDVFTTFLAGLLNNEAPGLCIATNVSLTHSGEDFSVTYSAGQAPDPTQFKPVPIGPPGPDGFTEVLNMSYSHTSSDDSESASHAVEIYGDFNYTFTGTIAFKDNLIRLTLNPDVYMRFHHREVFVYYEDLPGNNYYNKTRTVVWQIEVDSSGELQVTVASDDTADYSAGWDFNPGGILGKFGFENNVKNGLTDVENAVAAALDANLSGYLNATENEINSYHRWVFPGASSFLMKAPQFATSLDLVTEVTYANPDMNDPDWVPGAAAGALR